MSEASALLCLTCRAYIDLGKPIVGEAEKIDRFQIGDGPPNSEQRDLTRAVWKFLADHAGHSLEVAREYSRRYQDEILASGSDDHQLYTEIGDHSTNGPSFGEYLAGWSG